MAKGKPQFAPVPERAIGDTRLTASHWRVLATIAFHDRFGRDGSGCYAGAGRLAREAAIDPTNVARLTADLAEWGYVETGTHPLYRRLRTYSMIYQETLGVSTNDKSGDQQIVGKSTNEEPAILGGPNPQVADSKEQSGVEYIKKENITNRARAEVDAALHRRNIRRKQELDSELYGKFLQAMWSLPPEELRAIAEREIAEHGPV